MTSEASNRLRLPFAEAATSQLRHCLIDLDGTLVRGGMKIAGADALLRQLSGRFVVVSNNSTHTPSGLARELSAIGLDVPVDRLVLAGDVAMHVLRREMSEASIFFCGSDALTRHGEKLGLKLVKNSAAADVVLLARDTNFTYRKLCMVVDAVRAGALLFATNPDKTHPAIGGRLIPETGALLSSILSCPGTQLHRTVGKPEPYLFLEALRRLDAKPSETVVIGDNPETDGIGARRLGMKFLLANDGTDASLETTILDVISLLAA